MKFQKIAPLAVLISLGAAALPAAAGESYVENSYRLKSTFNGHSTTNVNVHETYNANTWADSSAVKTEWGSTTVTEAKDGRTFHETESFDIVTESSAREDGRLSRTVNVSTTESYDFSGFDKDHRVTSGFSF
ncbi:hypothetical protein [Acaryochloris sp. CCMEE 5410]|uniref:hypothetical protein n=1 Tax=Acaryochloris sp. CCMEE 5410 TaxID=310037 RepID=UPI00024849BF|nr:hypothetical protein [Acaryochloris sp. CCMEE 5410]KAI9133310.1 hypothetical protein ON05_008265 [Acaryochloris sp. CCMEE 5410]